MAAAAGVDADELATGRGEDYELLVTLPPERVDEASAAVAATGSALTRIGAVERGEGVRPARPDGSERRAAGFDQLRALNGATRPVGRRPLACRCRPEPASSARRLSADHPQLEQDLPGDRVRRRPCIGPARSGP